MYIHVKVKVDQKKDSVFKINKDHYEISVKEKARNNMANKRVIELLKAEFLNSSKIQIINGHQSPSKLISVTIPEEEN